MKKYESIYQTLRTKRPKTGFTDSELAQTLGTSYELTSGLRRYLNRLGYVKQLGTKTNSRGRVVKTWTAA